MNEFLILDVGHGNSAILFSEDEVAVFDAAPGDTLLLTLGKYNIKVVDHVFISHSDKDHVGGLINLIASKNLTVKNIYLNPDSTKGGSNIRRLRIAIQDAMSTYGLKYSALHTGISNVCVGNSEVEIIQPNTADFLGGPGGVNSAGVPINSNSSSAILRVFHNKHPVALLAGDMEQSNLDSISKKNPSLLKADILIFPHHGGNCSTDNGLFARTLLTISQAKYSVFSLGRESFHNPRPEIIESIRLSRPEVCIMCTQLSKNCLSDLPPNRNHWDTYLNDIPGLGKKKKVSCAGSLRIYLNGGKTIYPDRVLHSDFVSGNVPGALCNRTST